MAHRSPEQARKWVFGWCVFKWVTATTESSDGSLAAWEFVYPYGGSTEYASSALLVLELNEMRRILSLLVALGLTGIGSLPVSACALVNSQASECAAPQTKTDCERMGMDEAEKPPVTVSNASKTCCAIAQAPLPEAQTWPGSFVVADSPALTSGVVDATQSRESAWSRDIARNSSPPPLQSFLCTFLI